MRKDEKKTHIKFYHDQTNISWENPGNQFQNSGPRGGGRFWNFWKIPKSIYAEG